MHISKPYAQAPAEGRCPEELAAFAALDELKIPYTRVEHDPADTMEDCADISEALGVSLCKNLFLCNRQQTDFYLLCMPADKPFKTKDLSRQIGSARLSFASGEDMVRLLGCTPGSASILGLRNDTGRNVRLLIDRPVAEAEWFGCHPCKNDGSLKIKTADLFRVFLPSTGHDLTVVDLPKISEPAGE